MPITTRHLDWSDKKHDFDDMEGGEKNTISMKEAREEMVKRIDMLLHTQEGREKIGKVLGCKIES